MAPMPPPADLWADLRIRFISELAKRLHQYGITTTRIEASVELLSENPKPTEEEIRDGLHGNLCRCTGYHNIVKSVAMAADMMGGTK